MNARNFLSLLFCVVTVLFCAAQLSAQNNSTYTPDDRVSSRTRALDEADSRAEKEAERLVALSPDKIILILQQEPGLFLEVKKMYVRRAYADGQIVDRKELTDDVMFRHIREDQEFCALVTQQIVDRGYIKPKPTQEELTRQLEERQKMIDRVAREQENEEEAYGENQRGLTRTNQNGSQPSGTELQNVPATRPNAPYSPPNFQNTPQAPQNLNNNQQRQLLQAGLTNTESEQDENYGLPLNVINGQSSNTDQLEQAVNAGPGQFGAALNGQSKLNGIFSTGNTNVSPAATQPSQEQAYALQQQEMQPAQQPHMEASLVPPREFQRPVRKPSDQPILLHEADPYADVPSLYDLYTQYSRRPNKLERFGSEIFENGTGNLDQLPMDLPAGPEYVLGPGDTLDIDLWGSVSQRLHRTIDREGRLSLPEIGAIQASGHTLGEVQHIVQTALRTQFRQLEADISLDRVRSVRVYVVGDVERPGAYDISSLSTPLNALYEAGGPTAKGSLRLVKHYRGSQLVETVDLYDLLLHGVRSGIQRLESGDTVLVPPVGEQITIRGMVRRPAIYELAGEKSLADVLELAGGVLPSGTLRHVDVERVQAHESRTMLAVDIPEKDDQASVTEALEKFQVDDGDTIKISPILPFANKTVYLDGHVFRPGKYAYTDGMKITDLVHGYKDILPEPYKRHAEIIRLKAPDYQPEILAFNLEDALDGKQDITLQPFDTVRIFGRYDFEDQPVITVTGEVRDPGDHVTNGTTYLRDAIFLAGNTTPDAELNDVQIFRKTQEGKLEVLNADLSKALAGDPKENVMLLPQDRVFVHKDVKRLQPATVEVQGEVARPGTYPLGSNMTAAELVRVAGGLTRSAYADQADLTRYTIEGGSKMETEHLPVSIGEALSGTPDADMRLRGGDVLTIRQVAGWKDIGATVKIDGEVVHPGTYGIEAGERLSDVIARAGGFRSEAYPYGAIFERAEIREIEEKSRAQLISDAQEQGGALGATADDPLAKSAALSQWRDTLHNLQTTPPVGRLIVHISPSKSWVHSQADIQLRAGDSVYIPKKPNFVMVQGAVYNQTGITYRSGKSAAWYLHQAGGPTSSADRKDIFIVRADGTVTGGPKGLFTGGALDAELRPGDMIMVPNKAFGGGAKWKQVMQVSELVSAVGIAVQVARGF
ncbi:MAG TPA: SLBB domain-containing protein [Terriglobales bacterium]|nr:SLBB domain-containing protein [Terriglobales bacterium]